MTSLARRDFPKFDHVNPLNRSDEPNRPQDAHRLALRPRLPRCVIQSPAMRVSHPVRILYVVGNSDLGGAENHVLALVRHLDPQRYAVQVVCPRTGPLVESLHGLGVPVHLIDMVRPAPGDEYELYLPALWEIASLVRRMRPHVVHSHLYPAHLHASLVAELHRVPAVLTTAHTLVVRPGDSSLAKLTRSRTIAVSQAAKDLLVRGGVPRSRIRVVRNGIEPRYFRDESAAGREIRRQLGIRDGAPVIGTIARLSPEKGHRQLLHIARDVLDQRPEARFLIVGDGPLKDELHATAAGLGLTESVTFTGPRQDIPAVNYALDVFLLTSREEALPLAIVEAMAAGRPVVASVVGGVPEVVLDGSTGFLYPPADHAGFVRAILNLIDRPDLRLQLGSQGRERAQRRFGLDRMVQETVRYYRASPGAR